MGCRRQHKSKDKLLTIFKLFIRSFVVFLGLFYPVFYIQLLANLRGVDPNLAFYAVSPRFRTCRI